MGDSGAARKEITRLAWAEHAKRHVSVHALCSAVNEPSHEDESHKNSSISMTLTRRARAAWPRLVGAVKPAPASYSPSALLILGLLCRNHQCMVYVFDLLNFSSHSTKHYLLLRRLMRRQASLKPFTRVHVHIECSRTLSNLHPERIWGRLLAIVLNAHITAEGAIAVISTLGGAYATLRQSQRACAYAVKLYRVAQFMGDKSRMLRAQVYYMLGVIMGSPPTSSLLKRLRILKRKAEQLGDVDVSGLVEYARVRLIPEIYRRDSLRHS